MAAHVLAEGTARMNTTAQPYSYKSPALYNPRLWNANEVRAYYVARPALLDRIVDDLKREDANNHPQHRLIVGLRGMGKSTLLRRLAVAVEDDAPLNANWLPLSFPEEQYNVASLSDFWLNCLDALSDLLESRGQVAESARLDAEVEQLDRKDGEGALGALLRVAGTLQRRLLLLVDNVDLVFDRIKTEDWKLREVLQAHPEILIAGASAKVLEDTYNYKAAFYDFFKIDELRGLSEAEMRETIINLARLGKAEHIIERINTDPARLRVLHTLTGGNPRTAVLLYGVLLKGIDGDVRSDLEGLLDEVTPLYKARFEELPPQSQQLLDKLALHWHPASAAVLTKQLGWKVNLVSAQLDRLIGAGIVEKVKAPKSKRLNFQIGERFFNIWYLMRTSRRLRRRLIWLVECLRGLYNNEELQAMAKRRMQRASSDIQDAETLVALSDALDDPTYKRALTDCALELLTKLKDYHTINELFDTEETKSDLKLRQTNIQFGEQLRMLREQEHKDPKHREWLATALLIDDDIKKFETLPACQQITEKLEHLYAIFHTASERAVHDFGPKAARLLASATKNNRAIHISDREGMAALALRENEPYFAAIAILLASLQPGHGQADDIEAATKVVLEYDDQGLLPWVILMFARMDAGKITEAAEAARRAMRSDSIPFGVAATCAISIVDVGSIDPIPYLEKTFSRFPAEHSDEIETLLGLANIAVEAGKGLQALAAWDKTFPNGELLPFREALNAAAHNDGTLLELLAPEVKEPAKQFLAIIAPKLLQQTGE
jgi:hypothetical protein